MTTSSVSHSALQFALAALANSGSGGGGGGGGTVKVRVVETITGAPGTQAEVKNLGTDTDVLLQFTIPAGAPGAKGDPGEDGKDGIDGKDGKDGSQWLTSDAEPGTPIEGAVDGDMILYDSGAVYKVVDGTPKDTGIDLILDTPSGGTDPYHYALSIGFVGTKTEFDIRFLAALKDVATDTITSGGEADTPEGTEGVVIDGGIGDKKNYEIVMSGNNVFSDGLPE